MILSNKLKHSLAASLGVAFAFLFPLYFGIEDTSSAAIIVMIIGANDSLGSSLVRGVHRVLGTIFGAVVGMVLISLFPQERFLYLFLLSVLVSFTLYVARAYRGDQTIFLLTAMTMMMVFDGGAVDDIFLYATEKVMMSVVGIAIYTFLVVYVFPTSLTKKQSNQTKGYFVWGDVEDIKGAFITFCVFWLSAFLWIYFAIPYGYYIMVLATSLSLYTTYSVVKPSMLIVLYSFSFVVATLAYIFVLPNIEGWWSLSIFLTLYSFFGFHFINPKISIFYLLGMATFLIENEMQYNFAIFLFVLLIFYLFLFVLLFLDYFPFNQKSEHMFLVLHTRFKKLLELDPSSGYIQEVLTKMKHYATKIDYQYFEIKKEDVMEYCRLCEVALREQDLTRLQKIPFEISNLKRGRF